METNLDDEGVTPHSNAGFVFGWTTALCEHNPDYFFTSQVPVEPGRHF
jgi:hypothetical protein